MKILAVLLCLIGCTLLYCSHDHQNILQRKLATTYAYAGLSLLIFSLTLLLMSVPLLVAVYMWLMTVLVVWSLIPLMTLLKKHIPNEISDSRKNPT